MAKEKLLNIGPGKGDRNRINPSEWDAKQTIYCEHNRFKDKCPVCNSTGKKRSKK